MAAPLILRIIGDATSYFKTADSVVVANKEIGASALSMGRDFTKSAEAQIAAGTKAIQVQRAMVAELTAAKTAAVAGSDEQIAATVALQKAQASLNRTMGVGGFAGVNRAAQTAERDLGKATRGLLAGSGAALGMGRSLAFASGGFLAFAAGAELVSKSITGAEGLEKAQRSLDVAIKHTHGDLTVLQPLYEQTAKSAAEFGVSQADATTGLARATVLTGNASAAQRAYQEALVISKATGKDFNSVLIATSKGQEGITTSLRRYGILVDSTSSGTEQFTQVMKRFGGQAAANTTATEKLHAAFANAEATIGEQLLPTFNKLAGSLADWLTKMNESGQLQKDVATGMTLIQTAATPLIKTLGLLAQTVGALTSAWSELNKVQKGGGILGTFAGIPRAGLNFAKQGLETTLNPIGSLISALHPPKPPPAPLIQPGVFGLSNPSLFGAPSSTMFGGAQPLKQYWKAFALTFKQQIAQAQAALTKGTADDVAEARKEINLIKTLINNQQIKGPALLQAYALGLQAIGVIQSAEQAAAQQQAAKIAAAKQKLLTQIQNAIDPINLQIALAKAESLGKGTTSVLRQQLAAAYNGLARAIANGNKQLILQAYQQITSLKQAIKDSLTTASKTFTEPMKLQIALARAQAFGGDTTSVLKQMKAAALKALRSGKYTGQSLIDLLNEIANINSQLNSNAATAYGDYKKASVKALTQGLDLTADARRRLEARLAQRGPGGTVPGDGTGAAGYVIDPDTGRPVRRGHHRRHRGSAYASSGGGGGSPSIHADINLTVNIDGKQVEASVTKHQQRRRRHNPTQTRGPNAATATA